MTRVWLVTGSSRGIGRSLAKAVLEAGDHLVATARDPSKLAELVRLHGTSIRAVAVDVTDERAVDAAMQTALDAFGRVDVVVNNAGYGELAPIENTPMSAFRQQIETNLFGTIIVTKAALPILRRQGSGHFIQFSSVGGRIGSIGRAPYSAAKWGVEGFSEVLAKEVFPLGIKVTIVEPGGFRTDFAGASTILSEGHDAYDATVGAAARFQRSYDGRQPGDPARAAEVILQVAAMDNPPLRLLLGSDAVRLVEAAEQAKFAADLLWRPLSVSTDFKTIAVE
jgi:NAD(P)-dependent dehydrogenase (short-subunit alcohol dehydrogenase family)